MLFETLLTVEAVVICWMGSLSSCGWGLPGRLMSLMGSSSVMAGRLSTRSMGASPPTGGAQGAVGSMWMPGGVEMWMFGTGVAAYGLFGVLVAEGCINMERTLCLGGVAGG